MKVLIARSVISDSGPGTQSLLLALEARSRGIDSVFVTGGGVFMDRIGEAGFPVETVPGFAYGSRNPISVLRGLLRLRSVVRQYQPDVIHGHNGTATLLTWLAALSVGRRLPAVTSVRGVEERKGIKKFRNIIWWLTPGRLIAVCQNGVGRLQNYGIRRKRIDVSYNGVDLTRFDPGKVDPTEARREFGLEDRIVFGVVGAISAPFFRNSPGKGQDILVRALVALRTEVPNAALLLIGDGNMRGMVEDAAKEAGVEDSVVLAGRRTDIPYCMSAMDVFCLPSVFGEFFPNVILEAMAMGLPWIGSDIAGLKELTADSEAGWVLEPGNVEQLTAAMRKLAADPQLRAARGARGRQEVERRFTIQMVFDRYLESYRKAGAPVDTVAAERRQVPK